MNLLKAEGLARRLLEQHGCDGWDFQWDNSERRFGICRYAQRVIGLSRKLVQLNELEKVLDTILHEIAHVKAPLDGHGSLWKGWAAKLGATPKRCYDESVVRPPHAYEVMCLKCGKRWGKYLRRPRWAGTVKQRYHK